MNALLQLFRFIFDEFLTRWTMWSDSSHRNIPTSKIIKVKALKNISKRNHYKLNEENISKTVLKLNFLKISLRTRLNKASVSRLNHRLPNF